MADVPILDEPRLRAPLIDIKTGHATTDFSIFLSQLYRRVGVATGDLPTDLVKTLAIKDLNVTNPKIADNAATITGSALSSSALSFKSTSYVTIQSITLTPSSVHAMFIYFNSVNFLDNSSSGTQKQGFFRISRDATILHPEGPLMFVNANSTFESVQALSYVDLTPPATPVTYKLEFRLDDITDLTTAESSERTELLLEARK